MFYSLLNKELHDYNLVILSVMIAKLSDLVFSENKEKGTENHFGMQSSWKYETGRRIFRKMPCRIFS